MLFDLRSPGRRAAIKVIYGGLAVLLGGGLIFFGIGGEVSGGLFDAFRDNQSQFDDSTFAKQAERAEAVVAKDPQNAAAWAEIARRRFQVAGQGENFDQNTQQFSEGGQQQLRIATRAWERHVALAGDKADPRVARSMLQAYVALDQLDKAVAAQEVVVDASKDPTPELYAQLATYAYAADQTRKGDLAKTKALELETDKASRQQLEDQLDSVKQQAAQAAVQQATGGATGQGGASPFGG
jgi:hypothetical protein